MYRTKKSLPIPDDKVNILYSGSLISYQGYIGKNVLETIEYTESGLDPKDKQYFSYYLTRNKKYFQLLTFLEEENKDVVALNNNMLNKSQAIDYSERYPKIKGKKLGILIDSTNRPIQELDDFKTNGLELMNSTDNFKAIFDNSFLSGTGGYIGGFLSIISKNDNIIKNDPNGIAYFDFDKGLKNIFNNYLVENIGNLKVVKTDLNRGLKCDGLGRLVIGNGLELLGGRDEFLVYISYKVEKGDNISYNIAFATFGNSGYNFRIQHNFTNIDNSTFLFDSALVDGNAIRVNTGNEIDIDYGNYNNVLISSKDGKWFIVRNGNIIKEGTISSVIVDDALNGLGLCSRSTGGYELKGIIDKFYVSKNGIDKKGLDGFLNLINF
ncbi:MAG: hypothetical protein Q9M94_04245 [Candidatus Gracilibacteria bacterium]|nr:hypothetical protein [Candidatus Gracilibacteria bacterium]MDQ7022176.1 hypothetical protein [Candidatus Gracilibacteria bacterium]